jgi:hypothetical protein
VEETIREGYVRVSEILNQWSLTSNIPREMLERKGEIGTKVHDTIRDFIECIPTVLSEEEGGHYYRSFLEWYAKEKPTFQQTEERYYDDELKITGRIDNVMTLPGKKELNMDKKELVLVDWKCSHSPNNIIWNMQANFYMYLLERNGYAFKPGKSKAIFVKLDKTGELPKVYTFPYTEASIQACKGAAIAYEAVKELIIKKQKNELYIDI